ncbi:TNF receptor-associated factor 6-like isoform X1 [Neocloeon triangulifer]|uniref:TNF receptor-associated factor 6-like isoform X1 n=1 Tax=Neocloeon triangulifer TaxID=2078957 RepID=UPI00286EB866|nr:TNF receptor-associated factor 6-like isoform X1 [Neocloeon triangulifer]
MRTIILLFCLLRGFAVRGAGVPAPDDSEATIIPPSLLYKGRHSSGGGQTGQQQEVQCEHPSCKLDSDDLVNMAKAAVNRVIKDMCCGNSREGLKNNLDDRLHNLESQFADQMNVLKTMLLNMEERISEVDGNVRKVRYDLRNSAQNGCPSCDGGHQQLLSQLTDDQDPNNRADRESEIQLYNSSIYYLPVPSDLSNETSKQQLRVFTYYWRVKDMQNKLKNWEPRRSVRSPSFYISAGSYKMYLRMFPRQNNGKNVYLHVGLTKGDHDTVLRWPFRLKMRVSVLDQRIEHVQDINSRVWDPSVLCSEFNWKRPTANADNHECVGLGFPHEVLASRDYVVRNTIIIKFTVYLDL